MLATAAVAAVTSRTASQPAPGWRQGKAAGPRIESCCGKDQCNSVPRVLCCTEFPVFRDAALCLSQTDLPVADQAVHPNLEGVLSLSAVFTFPRLEHEIRQFSRMT